MKNYMKNKLLTVLLLCSCFIGCGSDATDNSSTGTGWSALEKKDALDNCISSGNTQPYCECSVEILVSLLSYSEFTKFDENIRSGSQPPSEIVSKVMRMSKRVSDECKK